ncbi:MAG TPA: serine/threonine-protein kinase [Bryobacteraceae bacterium]|nr:serine/threonine-protein kinase [Bryobacteraceae bacterium]
MDSERWSRVQELFHEAADRPAAEQHAFLAAACGADHELLAEVLALLEEDSQNASLLDRDLAHFAESVLDSPTSAANQQIGPYRLRELLGEGGMGVVYRAERQDLGNDVAVKILRDAWMSPARRERFTHEQRTLAQMNHPSIARLYDADTIAGAPWFAMEYVEGVPLTEYCTRHNCSISERLQLFRSVCEAVQYAHSRAIIHRDLKPSNILVKSGGDVRLLDFGIAKHLDDLDTAANRTMTGLRLMTPAYAAPEQVRGEDVGIHTDVYSLGVVLFELLTGHLPDSQAKLSASPGGITTTKSTASEEGGAGSFARAVENPASEACGRVKQAVSPASGSHAKTRRRNRVRHHSDRPNPAIDTDLNVLCRTAMHPDAQRRYASVEALIRDIDHYLKDEPLEARPDDWQYRLGKFVTRNRSAVIAAAAVLLTIVGLVTFFTVRLAKAKNIALSESAQALRVKQFMLNLFEGGDKEAGPAENLRVLSLLDRGIQEARSLDSEPAIQAELYGTLGGLYQRLGKFDQADALMQLARDRRIQLFGAKSPEAGDSTVALALLRVDQSKLDEAEHLVRDGLETIRGTAGPSDSRTFEATVALGKVLQARGAYDQSIAVLDDAIKRQASEPPPAGFAHALNTLAESHFFAGHYDISEALNRRALAIHRRVNGDRHPLVADDLMSLGAIQFQRGKYVEAEQLDRQAFEIKRSFYGEDHPETATTLTTLGQALVFEDRYDDAEQLLERALSIRERIYGPVSPLVASTLNELGNIASMREHLNDAEARFRRVLDIYRKIYGDNHYLVALATSNLASIYFDRKDYATAETMFRDVVARFTKTLSPTHMNTGIAEIKLGRAILRQKRYREAETHTLAGYNILRGQASPSTTFLRSARKDLAAIYDGLHEPEKADHYRAEQAAQEAAAHAAKLAHGS